MGNEDILAEIDATPLRREPSVDDEDFPLELNRPERWQDWQDDGVPPRLWALDGWIPHRQATYLTGPGSAGKSLLVQQLLTCAALGRPFMGVETRQAVALYVSCEDDIQELMRRQVAICDALGVKMTDLERKLYLASWTDYMDPSLVRVGADNEAIRTGLYDSLTKGATLAKIKLIGLDNVAHLFAGNENIRNHVAAFVSAMNGLAAYINGSVVFIGHPNKLGQDFSGSTAWSNQVRSRLYLETPAGDDGVIADPDLRVLTRAKANYARNGEELRFRWHQWAFVRPNDLPPDTAAEIARTVMASADNDTFLRCLDVRNGQERAVSENPSSRTYAPRVFAAMAEAKGISAKRLEAAMDRLFRIEKIERGFLWRADRKDRFGLRRKCADVRADPAPTGCADVRAEDAPTCALTHPYIKDIEGAAPSGSAAPFPDCVNGNPALGRQRGTILAPGESPDDPVPGCEWCER